MSVDYDRNERLLNVEGPLNVVVLKRYDDEGGIYSAATYRKAPDEAYEATLEDDDPYWDVDHEDVHSLDFLKYHNRFREALVERGFVSKEFADLPEDERNFITHNILPIEWHNAMDELGSRVQVYQRSE